MVHFGYVQPVSLIFASGVHEANTLKLYYTRANQRRKAGLENDVLAGKTPDKTREMGDAK